MIPLISQSCLVLVVEVLLGLLGLGVSDHGGHLVAADVLPHDVGDGGGDQAEMDRQVHPERGERETAGAPRSLDGWPVTCIRK